MGRPGCLVNPLNLSCESGHECLTNLENTGIEFINDARLSLFAFQDGGTESCYRTVLSFNAIQWSHAGEWLLLVRSSEGISDASVLLNMTRASGYSHAHFRSPSLTYLSMCLALVILQEHRRWETSSGLTSRVSPVRSRTSGFELDLEERKKGEKNMYIALTSLPG